MGRTRAYSGPLWGWRLLVALILAAASHPASTLPEEDVGAGVLSDVTVSAEEPVPADVPADVSADVPADVSPDTAADVRTAVNEESEWDVVSEFPGAERQGAILQALSLGLNFTNASRSDCVWRKLSEADSLCPDKDVAVYLYTSPTTKRRINISEADALVTLNSGWNPQNHTVVLVHGYGSGDDKLPMDILIQAYLEAGGYNVLVLDWWKLARIPCYPAAVHNAAVAARCVGGVARLLRDSGARGDSWTCVGHSLGAHVCGLMADTVMFRVHKIIGLDPARPLIRPQNKHRLDAGDATVVHVMHTNAGHYGEMGAIGTADFCVNGGRVQPFCSAAKNPNLCSHVSSACFLADSLDGRSPLVAEPCGRRCPSARRTQVAAHKLGVALPASLGQHTPDSASGTFCASRDVEPYCQREPGQRGHPRCCPPRHSREDHGGTPTTTSESPTFTSTTEASTTETITSTARTPATDFSESRTEPTLERFIVGAAVATEATVVASEEPSADPQIAALEKSPVEIQSQLLIAVPDLPIRFPEDVLPTGMIPPPPPPPQQPKWTLPTFSTPNNVHVVMPSNDSALYDTETKSHQEDVFAVYSTKNPQAVPAPGPVVVVMANSDVNIRENLIESSSSPHRAEFIPSNPVLDSSPFRPLAPAPPSAPAMDETMMAMTEMGPPPPDTVYVSFPFASPSSSPPPPDPASPEDASMIPAAGSPTGAWLPMVMLPPSPFSSNSWMLRYKVARPLPMRRTTYRNYVYEK